MEKIEKKYMVLVDYENAIQGELCLVAHNLTYKEAMRKVRELRQAQNNGEVLEDFLIHNVNGSGISVVAYNDFVY